MKSSEMKKELILSASEDIVELMLKKHGVDDVDIYDIAEIINLNVGFVFETLESLVEDIKNGKGVDEGIVGKLSF